MVSSAKVVQFIHCAQDIVDNWCGERMISVLYDTRYLEYLKYDSPMDHGLLRLSCKLTGGDILIVSDK